MPLDISRIRALCFDIDGTLSDTDDQFVGKLAGWLHPVRILFPQRDPLPFARRVVMATENPANYLVGLPDRLGIDSLLSALGDFVYRLGLGKAPQPFVLISGVKEALDLLQPHYALSIVSTRGQRSSLLFLNQFGLFPFFRCIATSQTCRHTKPYPDPILWVAAQVGASPEACLMIGDTTVDIRAGQAAGAQTVGVLSGFGEEDELKRCGADLILPSVAQLPGILLAR